MNLGKPVDWVIAHQERCKIILYTICLAVIAVQWARIFVKPQGDFPRHWEFGRRFLSGEFLYAGGLNVPYAPFWGMANAPLTLLPPTIAQPLLYPFALAALAVLLLVLHRLTRDQLPLRQDALFWSTVLALLLSSRFIARDLIECGPNLAVLALTWASIYFWVHRREWAPAELVWAWRWRSSARQRYLPLISPGSVNGRWRL